MRNSIRQKGVFEIMNPKEHKQHKDFYEDDCNLCQLEQRLNQVLEMDEFKHFNPFTEENTK
jgi:hypothetical protein